MSNSKENKRKKIMEFLEKSLKGELVKDEKIKFLKDFIPEKVTAEDLSTFAEFMIDNMARKLDMPGAIDICGTGGSGLMRINTSTIASFLLADLGVKIAKHGNKSASGRFGSFDLLEEFGMDLEKCAEELEDDFKEYGLAFIYARNFHPVMKHFADARSAIGTPTIFNMLGPLLNPASVKRQIIGTSFEGQMKMIAEACKLLGEERVMVVRGCDGLDEVTLTGNTKIVELKDGEISEYEISPMDFGIDECDFEDIKGGDKEFNVKIAREILEDHCESRHADLVYVNMALALRLAGVCEDLKKGYEMAKRGNILEKIAGNKYLPKSERDFAEALRGEGVNVIAEIKKASPSKGDIFQGDFDPVRIALEYEKADANAISVLTDEKFFKGSFEYLRAVSESVKVPILCKDFIVHEYQIYKAREYGADAVLLIAALLSDDQLERFMSIAASLGMHVMLEVHNEEEMKRAVRVDAPIIGINNRDLRSFEVDLETTNRLCGLVVFDKIVVSESGIESGEDVANLNERIDAILVGTCLMKSKDLTKKLHELKK